MASQRDVRTRIASVKNIQKITRAMEMVAAARLRRAEMRIEALRPYADALRRMTRQAAAQASGEVPNLPMLAEHESEERGRAAARRRRPRPRRRVQLADRPRRRRRRPGSTRPAGKTPVFFASGRRPASSLTFRGLEPVRELHRLLGPPGVRRCAHDRRGADRRVRRQRGRPCRDLLQRLHLADLAGRAPRDAAAARAGDDPR